MSALQSEEVTACARWENPLTTYDVMVIVCDGEGGGVDCEPATVAAHSVQCNCK